MLNKIYSIYYRLVVQCLWGFTLMLEQKMFLIGMLTQSTYRNNLQQVDISHILGDSPYTPATLVFAITSLESDIIILASHNTFPYRLDRLPTGIHILPIVTTSYQGERNTIYGYFVLELYSLGLRYTQLVGLRQHVQEYILGLLLSYIEESISHVLSSSRLRFDVNKRARELLLSSLFYWGYCFVIILFPLYSLFHFPQPLTLASPGRFSQSLWGLGWV